MTQYHKIQTMFKRDMEAPGRPIIENAWTLTEFNYLALNQWELTEKVDGMNIRVEWDGKITFQGKTDNAQIPSPLFARLAERFCPQVELLKQVFPGKATLYMEGYGPKIQKGGKYREDQDVVLFDVKVDGWWLRRPDIEDVASKLDLPIVPIIHFRDDTLYDAINCVKSGLKSRWGDFEAEGIVAKPMVELLSRDGSRIITKIKARDFKKE